MWRDKTVGTVLAAISRNCAIQIDSFGRKKEKPGEVSEERVNEWMRTDGRHATQALFRYSFNDVTRARTLVQLRKREKRKRRRNSTPYGITSPPRKSTLTPLIEIPIGWQMHYDFQWFKMIKFLFGINLIPFR